MRLKIGGGPNSVDEVKRDRWVDENPHMRMRLGVGFVIAVTPIVVPIWVLVNEFAPELCNRKREER